MKKTITYIRSLVVATLLGLVTLVSTAPITAAYNPIDTGCSASGASASAICANKDEDGKSSVTKIVNLLLYVLGIIAVIVIVISGIRYAVSGGDANAVKGAKDGILYAVIGLVVAVLAYGIVNLVLTRLK